MYWFDGALKGKLEGGVMQNFFRDNQKTTAAPPPPPPPLPIKNEQSLTIETSTWNSSDQLPRNVDKSSRAGCSKVV